MKILVAHTGEPCAGKETVSRIIARLAANDGYTNMWIQFRDPLQETLQRLNAARLKGNSTLRVHSGIGDRRPYLDILRLWGINPSYKEFITFADLVTQHFGSNCDPIVIDRSSLQKLAQVMTAEKAFGHGALSNAVGRRVVTHGTSDLVQIDGVRWWSDVEMLRTFKDALLMYTTANEDVRVARAISRRREGEESKSSDQLLKEWSAENERYIPEIGAQVVRSDPECKIVNNYDTVEALETVVTKFYKKRILPQLRSV